MKNRDVDLSSSTFVRYFLTISSLAMSLISHAESILVDMVEQRLEHAKLYPDFDATKPLEHQRSYKFPAIEVVKQYNWLSTASTSTYEQLSLALERYGIEKTGTELLHCNPSLCGANAARVLIGGQGSQQLQQSDDVDYIRDYNLSTWRKVENQVETFITFLSYSANGHYYLIQRELVTPQYASLDSVSDKQLCSDNIIGLSYSLSAIEPNFMTESTLYCLVQKIKRNPDKSYVLAVHSDTSGSHQLNQQLTEKRAQYLGAILRRDFSLHDVKLTLLPKGENEPIADVNGKSSKQRRVELLTASGEIVWN